MNLLESTRIAFRALAANKLRSALTMLGIIIGVGAVITLMSAGAAVQDYVTEQFRSIGSNLLFVTPGRFQSGPGAQSRAATGGQPLTNADAAALLDPLAAPDVAAVAPEQTGTATLTYAGESGLYSVSGVTPGYAEVRGAEAAFGRFLDEGDLVAASRVVVLGPDIVEDLFPENALPVGETIRINDLAFRVIGVMRERGGSGFGSEDRVAFIPLSTAQSRLFPSRSSSGDREISLIYVQAVSEDRSSAAASEVRSVLRRRHGLGPDDQNDFTVINQADILASAGSVLSTLTVFVGAIAAISLLVGGIGIMNIMLVSVTERTREIGLRKAVGARRRDILAQFLVESVVLSVSGGGFGILLGALGTLAVGYFAPDIEAGLSPQAALIATAFAAAVGLFFGIYPATRAASLDPIQALRYE